MHYRSSTKSEWRMVMGAILWLGLLGSCGGTDPILERADEIREKSTGNSASSASGEVPDPKNDNEMAAGPATATHSVGSPSANNPGIESGTPGVPQPGEPPDPQPVRVDATPHVHGTGTHAEIAGTVVAPAGLNGTIYIKAFESDPSMARSGGPHPRIVREVSIAEHGAFTMVLANDDKPVWLDAHMDLGEANKKPDPEQGEPIVPTPLKVLTNQNSEGIVIELVVRPPESAPAQQP